MRNHQHQRNTWTSDKQWWGGWSTNGKTKEEESQYNKVSA